jgi:hypothetical protein
VQDNGPMTFCKANVSLLNGNLVQALRLSLV